MLNFADYLDQSLYQKSVESRRLIERVTQQQRKACRFQRDNNLRDRNLNEGEIVILNIDDTWRTCRDASSLAEEAQTWKAFSEEWAKIGRSDPGVGRG
jgi:hypothetical protein